MGFDTNMAKTVHRLLKKRGQEMTLYRDSTRPYDRDTGKAIVTTLKYKAYGVIIPLSTEDIHGTLVEAGDMRLILAAYDTDGTTALRRPNENDRGRDAALNKYMIKQVLPIAPAGTIIFYDCLIKGSG